MGALHIKKFLFSLIFICFQARGSVTYVDHFLLQFAGEIGLLSFGLGRDVTPKYTVDILYGIVPPELSKASTIETVTLRQAYVFYDWDRLDVYTVLNLYHALGIRYQISRSGDSPRGYYPLGSVRGLIGIGTAISIDNKKTHFYFETALNDVWIVNSLSNAPRINPYDKISLALGYKFFFN